MNEFNLIPNQNATKTMTKQIAKENSVETNKLLSVMGIKTRFLGLIRAFYLFLLKNLTFSITGKQLFFYETCSLMN